MPLYEYQCETCGRFELIRKFSDEPVTACPTCGQPKRPHRVCPTCGTYKGREVEPLRIDAP